VVNRPPRSHREPKETSNIAPPCGERGRATREETVELNPGDWAVYFPGEYARESTDRDSGRRKGVGKTHHTRVLVAGTKKGHQLLQGTLGGGVQTEPKKRKKTPEGGPRIGEEGTSYGFRALWGNRYFLSKKSPMGEGSSVRREKKSEERSRRRSCRLRDYNQKGDAHERRGEESRGELHFLSHAKRVPLKNLEDEEDKKRGKESKGKLLPR